MVKESGQPILLKNIGGTLSLRNQADDTDLTLNTGNYAVQSHGNEKHTSTFITNSSVWYQWYFFPKHGTSVAGSWSWYGDGGQTDFADITSAGAGSWMNGGSHNDGDEYKWASVLLPAGTYSVSIASVKGTNRGIAEVLFGTTSIGTQDLYGALTYNFTYSFSFTLVSPTRADMRFKCTGKNGASSDYWINFSKFIVTRTS